MTPSPAFPGARARPAPPPPRVDQTDLDELAEALPRVARTGPARHTSRPGVPPAPVMQATSRHRPIDDIDDEDAPRSGLPRVLKWTGIAIVGAALTAGAGAIALMLYAPVDLVRDRLVAEVKARTGRDLTIGGKPSISFWPHVAVSVSNVTLSNPPGMAGAPLVTMPRLDATIQFLPLLSKQVLVDRIVLQSPRITLVTDTQGRRNWDFAEAPVLAPTHGARHVQFAKVGPLDINDLPEDLREFAKGATDANRGSRSAGAEGFALGRIRIIDGALLHVDERSKTGEEFKSINMTIEAGDAKGPLQATGTFVWHGEAVRLDTRVMPLQALATGAPAQTTMALTSEAGQVTFAGTAVGGGATPKLEGLVTAKSPSIAKASQWLGRPIVGEMTTGPFTFKGRVTATGTKLGIVDTTITAPDLHMTGALSLDQSGPRPKLTGAVRVADLNLEAFLRLRMLDAPARAKIAMPSTAASTNPAASPQSIEDLLKDPTPKPQVRGYLNRDGWRETPLDLSALGFADADVRVAFGRMTSNSLNTNQGQVHLVVAGRTAKFMVDDLALHDGKARGTLVFDAAHAKPSLTIAMTMDGVALGPLLKDLGADSIEGRAKVTFNVTGIGHTERQIVDTLAGKAEITIPRGTISGYDVGAIVRGLAQMKLPRAEPDPKAKTDFTDFGAAFTINKGIADNRDFRIVTREARAIGSGQIALGPRTIDFTMRPKVTAPAETPSGLGVNLAALDLPIRITGPLAQPNISADLQSLAANPAKALEAVDPATRREVEDTVKGVLAGDDAAKAKARDVLNKLFGR